MNSPVAENLWMIRDGKNVVRGPFKREEICDLLKKNQLKSQTEICQGNSYWFPIEELREVARFFPEIGGALVENSPTMTITQLEQHSTSDLPEQTVVGRLPSSGTGKTPSAGVRPEGFIGSENKAEWLSDEFAEEFGEYQDSVSLQDYEATARIDTNEFKDRASVKADTLPSEYKDSDHTPPKPINALVRAPGTTTKAVSATVNVANNMQEPAPRILLDEENKSEKKTSVVMTAIFGIIIIAGLISGGVMFYRIDKKNKQEAAQKKEGKKHFSGTADKAVRKSILLFDLLVTKEALNDLEINFRGKSILGLTQAVFKKEFMFDVDGALIALHSARGYEQTGNSIAEIENLSGVYGYEKDPAASIAMIKKASDLNQDDDVFRYNLVLGFLRAGNYDDALDALKRLALVTKADPVLEHDIAILHGWIRMSNPSKAEGSAEEAFQRALKANPNSAKAHLGLAVLRLKKQNPKEAEAEFRQFIDLVPELEDHSVVVNFRKMNNFEFYNYIRDMIRELNVPGGVVGARPSALIMAVDAMLSCLQNRNGEAGKILEGALNIAAGDPHIMKAVGYHRFREGKFDEVIELLGEQTREKNSFAVNVLLGLASERLGKRELAEKYYASLTANFPMHSEGFSLLGDVLSYKKMTAEATKNYQAAITKDLFDLRALRGLDKLGDDQISTHSIFETYLPF